MFCYTGTWVVKLTLLFSNAILATRSVEEGRVTTKLSKVERVTKFVKHIKGTLLAIGGSQACEKGFTNKSDEGFTNIRVTLLIICGAVII